MGISERKQRQKEEVKQSIVCAARQMLIDEGWQSLSIRKIADAIEYSIPVIYGHFENKEALQLELTREGYNMLSQKVKEAQESVEDPALQIEKMAYAYWEFAFSNKQYYQMMYGLGIPTCENAKKIEEIKLFGDIIRKSISEFIAKSNRPETDMYLKFHVFLSMLHGQVSINLDSQTATNKEMALLVLKDSILSFVNSIRG